MKGLNLSNFKKVRSDKHTTTLEHPDGHKITIAHKALSPKMRSQLVSLPEVKPIKMADGGNIPGGSGSPAIDAKKAEEISKGASQSGWQPKQWAQNLKEGLGFWDGGHVPKPDAAAAPATDEDPNIKDIDLANTPDGQSAAPADAAPLAKQSNAPVVVNVNGAATPQQAPAQDPGLAYHVGNAVRQGVVDAVGAMGRVASPVVRGVQNAAAGLAGVDPNAQEAPDAAGVQQQQAPQAAAQVPPQQQAPSAPQQPSDPYGVNTYQDLVTQGIGEQKAGLAAEAQATGAEGAQEAKALKESAAAKQKIFDGFSKDRLALEKERQDHMKDAKNGFVDPDKYWENHSKIQAAIGLIIGGFNPSSHSNGSAEFLNDQINRSIQAQAKNLDAKNNLLSATVHQFGNLRDGADMARVLLSDTAADKLKQAAAQAKDPLAKARLLQQWGILDKESAATISQLAMRRTLLNYGQGGQNNGEHVPVPVEQIIKAVVPEQHQEKTFKELQDARNSFAVRDNILSAFDQASKINTLSHRVGSPLQSNSQLKAIIEPVIAEMSKATAGRFTEQDAHMIASLMPKLSDTDATRQVKRARIVAIASERLHFPLLDALRPYGVDIGGTGRYGGQGESLYSEAAPDTSTQKK